MSTDETIKALERQVRRSKRINEARAELIELLDPGPQGVSALADDRWQMAFFKYAFFSIGFLFEEVGELQSRQEGLSDEHQDLIRRMKEIKEGVFADNTRILHAIEAWGDLQEGTEAGED